MANEPDTAHGIREGQPDAPIPLPTGSSPGATDAAQSVPAGGAGPVWLRRADLVLLALLLALGFLLGSFAITNSDFFLYLATGRLLSDGSFEFGYDPFALATEATAARPAIPWVCHHWLFSYALYGLYNLVGGPGLVILKALLLVVLIVVLFQVRQAQTSWWLLIVCLTLSALAISTRFVLQPTVVSILLLGVTMYVLHRAGVFRQTEGEGPARPRLLWILPPLFALWANLDEWFVLGPLVLGLCTLAAGLLWLLRLPRPVPGRMLALVFVVGVLACLLNPYGVRVFQLPAELAYILLTLTGPLGRSLPDGLVGGGRALQGFVQAEGMGAHVAALSTLSWQYYRAGFPGQGVAGLAVFPLLLLGFVSFLLAALISTRPAAPVLQAMRFTLWVVFGLLALLNHNMIAFFAVIAGPLTALNLSEFWRWWEQRAGAAPPQVRPAALLRVLTLLFFVILLFRAWPGWLHVPADNLRSAYRVAWDVEEDPSLRGAAERLAELRSAGKCKGIFNMTSRLNNYCAWFAPGVKCFVDRRYALFPTEVEVFTQAREALFDRKRKTDDWGHLFRSRGLDHVEMQIPEEKYGLYPQFWAHPTTWGPVYADGKTAIFALDPDRPQPPDLLRQQWSREAYGEVPAARRPPEKGPPLPDGPPDFWTLYAEGMGRTPLAAREAQLKHLYFEYGAGAWQQPAWFGSTFGTCTQAVLNAFNGGGIAGPLTIELTMWTHLPVPRVKKEEGTPLYLRVIANRDLGPGRDHGPPEAAILMTRLARKAVADNPRDFLGYWGLADAYRVLQKEERHWCRGQATPYDSMREKLREMQAAAAMRSATQLEPTKPNLQQALANYYAKAGFLDLAAYHLQQAEQAARQAGSFEENVIRGLEAMRKEMDDEVTRRQGDYQLRASRAQGFEKFRVAILEPYRFTTPDNQVQVDRNGRGLVKTAIDVLEEMLQESNRAKLSEADRIEAIQQLLTLLLRTGQVSAAAVKLDAMSKDLGPITVKYYFYLAGVLGYYDVMQKELEKFELQKFETAAVAGIRDQVARHFSLATQRLGLGPLVLVESMIEGLQGQSLQQIASLHNQRVQSLDLMVLAGITALEAGDTARARQALREVLRLAGPDRFHDRPIAERYLELLDQYAR